MFSQKQREKSIYIQESSVLSHGNMKTPTLHAASVLLFTTILSYSALAQDKPKEEKPKVMGWSKSANLGVNLSFSSSQDVVGQTDGSSQTYGVNLKSGWNHNTERAEWRNEGVLTGTTTKTPSVPRYVKSADELKISSIYLYSLEKYPKIGPYARVEAAAPVFKGEDVRSAPKTYRYLHDNSTVTESSVQLTEGFKPLTTKEAVGFFYKPVQEERLKIEARVGFAAQQISADGQFAVKGVNSAGEVELNRLSDVNQAGSEIAVSVKGKANETSTYEVGAEAMTPFVNNKKSGDDRDALRLTNIDAFVKLSSNITSWASFGYDYKLKIQPQLVDRAQQIHMVVINMNYNLF